MTRLQTRLVLVFLAATLIPVAATLWITTILLERSLAIAAVRMKPSCADLDAP